MEIALIQDSTQYMFVESAIRGGVSVASSHYCKANNKYMKDFDPNERSSFIFYGDVTNLYGHCLSQKLPISNFKWADFNREELLDTAAIYNHDKESIGYLVEVDIDINDDLHQFFSDFPPIAERIEINNQIISPWTKLLLGDRPHIATEKLAPNLYNKRNYICHIANLQFYLKLGCQLKAVHKVLSFNQSAYLFDYIEFNTQQRMKAMSDFEKDFFKLMINSLFGL